MIKVDNLVPIEKDIVVSPYLTYAQIQNIVNAVCQFDVWSEREQNIDILVLYYATNLSQEEIEEYGHDKLIRSGVISDVKANVRNLNQVYDAISYTQSTARALNQIAKELPNLLEPLKRVGKGGTKTSSK